MTQGASLTDKETELVAVGASIGAGCQPCTQYHVRAALESGLSQEEVRRAIDEAQAVRREGGLAVSNVGRRLLGVEQEPSGWKGSPSDREGALSYIGAAAGCNAGGLLSSALEMAQELGLSSEELRSALEMAEAVKGHAADFLRRDAERALPAPAKPSPDSAPSSACCESGPATQGQRVLSGRERGTSCGQQAN